MSEHRKLAQHPASAATVETLLRMLLEDVDMFDSILISVQHKQKPESDGLAHQYCTSMKNGDMAWHKWMIDDYLHNRLTAGDTE